MTRRTVFSLVRPVAIASVLWAGCADKGAGAGGGPMEGTGGTADGSGSTGVGDTSGGGDGATGTTGDGGSSGSGNSFIATTGGADPQCDVWVQDCPDGEKCMPWANDGGNAWNATKCVPVDPNPKQPGDGCTVQGDGVSGIDDCDVASMCWNVDPETNTGYCVAFCMGTPEAATCADPEQSCLIANDGVLILCLPACDPLLQDCEKNEVCLPNTAGDGFACVIDASGGMGTAGVPCEFGNACNPGLVCAGAEFVPGCADAEGCCAPYCDLTDPDAAQTCANTYTTPGADCVPFFEMGMAPPGHEDVGLCILPQ